MAVYFIHTADDATRIKIGFARNVEKRLKAIAQSYAGGVVQIAECRGGTEAERAFHDALAGYRLEGEWFERSEPTEAVLRPYLLDHPKPFGNFRKALIPASAISPEEVDSIVAARLMSELFDKAGERFSVTRSQEEAFLIMNAINPVWSRRRVKSMWCRDAARIEFFEIRDIAQAVGRTMAEVEAMVIAVTAGAAA